MKADFTPERIQKLDPNDIFVFGSNLNGNHIGGAARIAYEQFGAEWGVGEGLTGQTYALPTLDHEMKCVTYGSLVDSFKRFIDVVTEHKECIFYLTKVGCGIAGWKLEDVRKAFWESVSNLRALPDNLVLPYDFYYKHTQPKMRSRYGLFKLPIEVLLKSRNQEVGKLKSYIQELEHDISLLKKEKETKSQMTPEEQYEACKQVRSEEMYQNIKQQNKRLRGMVNDLRRDKNDLLQKVVSKSYVMTDEERKKHIVKEEQMRDKLIEKARNAITEEEREMLHNQIVDIDSTIECMRIEELSTYD